MSKIDQTEGCSETLDHFSSLYTLDHFYLLRFNRIRDCIPTGIGVKRQIQHNHLLKILRT
jgi:hypothetical protein